MACSGLHCVWLLMGRAKQWNSCQIIHIIEIMEKWVNVHVPFVNLFYELLLSPLPPSLPFPSIPPFISFLFFPPFFPLPFSPSFLFISSITNVCHDDASRFVNILSHSDSDRNYLIPEDFEPLIRVSTHTHTHLCTYTSPQLHAHTVTLFCTPTCELHAWI